MSRTSCIRHPANEPLLHVHRWQLLACRGNMCAAAVLQCLIYWHDRIIDRREQALDANAVAARHGEKGYQDESLVQRHTREQLAGYILGQYSEKTIGKAVDLLVELGFVRRHESRFAHDRAGHYELLINAVQAACDATKVAPSPASSDPEKLPDASREISASSRKNSASSGKTSLSSYRDLKGDLKRDYSSSSSVARAEKIDLKDWTPSADVMKHLGYYVRDDEFVDQLLIDFRLFWKAENLRLAPSQWDARFFSRCVEQCERRQGRLS